VKRYSGKGNPPNQTLVNAFIISRVPISSSIGFETLKQNLTKDITESAERGFNFYKHSRRATLECMLRFIVDRGLLALSTKGEIKRTPRAQSYMARLPKRVVNIIDKLPMTDALTLLAGSAE
jgi:hypothetical protein